MPVASDCGDYSFVIWQANMPVASACGADLESVRREMLRYAEQYLRDGPIEIIASAELMPEDDSRDAVLYRERL